MHSVGLYYRSTVKPVKLTTFIRWPPTDVDHILVELAKSYMVSIYDHLHNLSTFICWIPVYVSHAKWNRVVFIPAYIDHGSTSGQSNGASHYVVCYSTIVCWSRVSMQWTLYGIERVIPPKSSRRIAFSCSNHMAVLLPVCIEFTGERYCTYIVVEEESWRASKINENSKHKTRLHDKISQSVSAL